MAKLTPKKTQVILLFFSLSLMLTMTFNKEIKINNLFQNNSFAIQVNKNIEAKELDLKQVDTIRDMIANQDNLNTLEVREFALGWYDRIDKLNGIDIMAEQGFNVIIPYVGYANQQDFGKIRPEHYSVVKNYLNQALLRDIKVLLQIPPDDVKNGNLSSIIKFIEEFKSHQSVYGWYLYDEPILKDIQPEQLSNVYNTIKEETPEKPVALLFHPPLMSSPDKPFDSYSEFFDIFMGEWYPSFAGEPEFNRYKNYGSSLRKVQDYIGDKSLITVLQAFGDNSGNNSNWRFPTFREERYMIYNAILSESQGIIFYKNHNNENLWVNWVDTTLLPLVNELKENLPPIINGKRENMISVNNSNVDVGFYAYNNQADYIIISVNHGRNRENVSFFLSQEITSTTLENRFNREEIHISNHQFTDTLDAYGVHIYKGQL